MQIFSCEFCEIFKNHFLIEHPRVAASEKKLITIDFFNNKNLARSNVKNYHVFCQ